MDNLKMIQLMQTMQEIFEIQISCDKDEDNLSHLHSEIAINLNKIKKTQQIIKKSNQDVEFLRKQLEEKSKNLEIHQREGFEANKRLEFLELEQKNKESKFQQELNELKNKIKVVQKDIDDEIVKNIERRDELNRLQIRKFENKHLKSKNK